ncbi:hypothetical protein C2I18_28885 [Paenibacillus sp. PK3_47]|uniref:hypothetical protein n=1 Tax=Paenibacillus sp. PK3_47 TaxID=2072642 RepID=UPI00201D6FBF|nr:hypothetical protein [Paenibacillus sp. PK3_47]UQZ37202.1 hypothetical protein C2I18_28885 [Paenibacillus sp. PK3_47]
MKKSMLTISFTLMSGLILGACSSEGANNTPEPTATAAPTAAATVPAEEATAAPGPAATPDETASPAETVPQASERPVTQEFGEQEGGVPGQAGTLTQGNGYSLYVFDSFAFDPAENRLSLAEDPDYYAEIELLPADYNLAALKQQGQTELSAMGEPQDYSGELIEHPLGFAELYLQVSGAEGSADYVVWKNQSGDAFLFRIHNPEGESPEFANWIMVSLASLETEG